jgi:hypothetical protein
MTASRSQGTACRRPRTVTVASRMGQSTGALLILAGPAAPRPGHRHGARAGSRGPAARPRHIRPDASDAGRRRPGQ